MKLGDVSDLPPTLSTEQCAELFGVSRDHLYALVREGSAPVVPLRLGRKLVWPTMAVLHALGLDLDRDADTNVVPIREGA